LAQALGTVRAEKGAVTPLSLLVTTWTRQGMDILHAGASEQPPEGVRLLPRFVPLDAPDRVRRALALASPRLLVLLETELWPGLLYAARERHVPVLILNGRMTGRSERNYLLTKTFWQALAPSRVASMSDVDASRFARVFPNSSVEVVPNIKFDQAVPAAPSSDPCAALPDGVHRLLDPDGRPLLLLASVREEEEAVLCGALVALLKADGLPPARLVVAPRHMHRVDAWMEHLRGMGLAPALRSSLQPAPGDGKGLSVIIWDAFGELQALYRAADAVFVGGGLAPLGGQNFLEALSAGLAPYTGPHIGNFAWALGGTEGHRLEDMGLLTVVPDATALWTCLADEARRGPLPERERNALRERFEVWLAPRRGGARLQAEILLRMLAL
jgi:3-deoxy-D-manno-octulosonic-acid transferase